MSNENGRDGRMVGRWTVDGGRWTVDGWMSEVGVVRQSEKQTGSCYQIEKYDKHTDRSRVGGAVRRAEEDKLCNDRRTVREIMR